MNALIDAVREVLLHPMAGAEYAEHENRGPATAEPDAPWHPALGKPQTTGCADPMASRSAPQRLNGRMLHAVRRNAPSRICAAGT